MDWRWTDGVDCWRSLFDPFRRWDRRHRLVRRYVRLCNSGWDHGAGWYISAGVLLAAWSLLGSKAALSKARSTNPIYESTASSKNCAISITTPNFSDAQPMITLAVRTAAAS